MAPALPGDGLGGAGQDRGYRKRVLAPHWAFIVERIEQVPHLTLRGLKDELVARGVSA